MHIVHAVLRVDPDQRDTALMHAREIAEASRDEPGIIDYRVTTDIENRNTLWFIERYEDASAVEAHLETEHYNKFEEAVIPDMLVSEPEIAQYEVTTVE